MNQQLRVVEAVGVELPHCTIYQYFAVLSTAQTSVNPLFCVSFATRPLHETLGGAA